MTANVETSSTVPPSLVAGPAKWTPSDAYRSVSGPSELTNSVGAVKSSKLIVRVAAVRARGHEGEQERGEENGWGEAAHGRN